MTDLTIDINHNGEVVKAMVDADDYPLLSRHMWFIRSDHGSSYPAATIITVGKHRKIIAMHNLIYPSNVVDHINGNKWDNRKSNLRPATHQMNGWNKGKPIGTGKKKYTSKYKGVRYAPLNGAPRWETLIRHVERGQPKHTGKTIRLGYFDNEDDAARAYNAKVKELRGEWAWLNPVPEICEYQDNK